MSSTTSDKAAEIIEEEGKEKKKEEKKEESGVWNFENLILKKNIFSKCAHIKSYYTCCMLKK